MIAKAVNLTGLIIWFGIAMVALVGFLLFACRDKGVALTSPNVNQKAAASELTGTHTA
jgi:hypothetical protein